MNAQMKHTIQAQKHEEIKTYEPPDAFPPSPIWQSPLKIANEVSVAKLYSNMQSVKHIKRI